MAQLIVERGWPNEEGGKLNKPGIKQEEAMLLIKDMMPALSKVDASAYIGQLIVLPGLKRLAKEKDKAGEYRPGVCLTCHKSLDIKDGNAYIYETTTFRRVNDPTCEQLGKCRCAGCLFSVRVKVSCLFCRGEYFRRNGKVDGHRNLAVEHKVYGHLYQSIVEGVAS